MLKPTQPAPLPYPGAPRDMREIVMQQVRHDEKFMPHLVYNFPEEVMRKELPPTKYPLLTEHNIFYGILRYSLLRFLP